MAISENQKRFAYKYSREVFAKRMSRKQALVELSPYFTNSSSPSIIIGHVYPKLMKGEKFTRTLSLPYFRYFLERIAAEEPSRMEQVLKAIRKHMEYRKVKSNDSKRGLKKLYDHYLALTGVALKEKEIDADEIEQQQVAEIFKDKSRAELLAALLEAQKKPQEKQETKVKRFKRDNIIIGQIKLLRNFSCQICSTSIKKRDNKKYVEAAHIVAKCDGGGETLDNILILCPNHHKEFDMGDRVLVGRTQRGIHFNVNGAAWKVSFEA